MVENANCIRKRIIQLNVLHFRTEIAMPHDICVYGEL